MPNYTSTMSEDALQIRLRALKRKTDSLRLIFNEQQLRLRQTRELIKETSKQLHQEKKNNKSKEDKIQLMRRFIASREASIKKRHRARDELIDEMKQHVCRRIFQLATEVFPIQEVNLLEHEGSCVNMEALPLLTFSDGSQHQIEQQTGYSIIEPWLPSDGDYSAYSLWVDEHKEHTSTGDLLERNPASRVGAALSYTTQFVKNIAHYLDVILPTKMTLDAFNRKLLNDSEFSYHVAKLNANVIYLCISQGIDITLLSPQKTLKNLTLLFDLNLGDLGRRPVIELDANEDTAIKIEDRLSDDLSLVQEDFYDISKLLDEDELSDSEWEISDNINPLEMMQIAAAEQSAQQNSYISRLSSLRLFSSFWTS